MCGKSSSNGVPSAPTSPLSFDQFTVAPNGNAPSDPIDPVARLRKLVNGFRLDLLRAPSASLNPIVDEIDVELTKALREAAKAKSDKGEILDTLLGEVQRGLGLDTEVAGLRGRVIDLELELDTTKGELEQMTENAFQAERTIDALTDIDPDYLVKAAGSVRGTLEKSIETAVQQTTEGGVPEEFSRSVIENAPIIGEVREATRQMIELSVAIERANDGVAAR